MKYDVFNHFNELKVLHTFAVLDEDTERAKELKKPIDKVHALVSEVSNEKARRILEDRLKGVSMRDIASSTHISVQTVYWYINKYLKEVEQQIHDVIEHGLIICDKL